MVDSKIPAVINRSNTETLLFFTCTTYRFEVRLAAVVSRGNVSDVDDPDATAHLRVRPVTVKVSDPSEDLLYGGGVIADDVGGLGHMITIPGDRKSQETQLPNKREEDTSYIYCKLSNKPVNCRVL